MDIAVDHETRTATLGAAGQPERRARSSAGSSSRAGRCSAPGTSRRSPASSPASPIEAPLVEDLAAGADRHRPGLGGRDPAGRAAADSKSVDLAVSLERAPMRTIAGQAGYGTGEGIRLEASWQHRNLLPPEGAVTFRGVAGHARAAGRRVAAGATISCAADQVLNAQVAASHVDRAAYDARTVPARRESSGRPTSSGRRNGPGRSAPSWSPPTSATSTSTQRHDPAPHLLHRRAARHASAMTARTTCSIRPAASASPLRLSPEASLQSARSAMAAPSSTPASTSRSRPRRARRRGPGSAPSSAPSRDRIAPSRRFYAGGGGSVRGYGFQRLGPRDPVFDDPIGGRSLTEFALEARIRVGGNWAIVPFLDGGNISTSPLPHSSTICASAPASACATIPASGRSGSTSARRSTGGSGDPRVAVYVSLGQAF